MGSFEIVIPSAANDAVLVVTGRLDTLGLEKLGDSTYVGFAGNGQRVGLRVEHYGKRLVDLPYCTDAFPSAAPPQPLVIADAVSGRATFVLSGVGRDGGHAITMSLENVVVRAPDGTEECIPDATFKSITGV